MAEREGMRILLDTTALIDILDGRSEALDAVEKLRQESIFFTSAINIYEVLKGIEGAKTNREANMREFGTVIANINVIWIDFEVARTGARIYAELRENGKQINEPDYLIAAAAITNGITAILTRNKKDFENISGIKTVIGY